MNARFKHGLDGVSVAADVVERRADLLRGLSQALPVDVEALGDSSPGWLPRFCTLSHELEPRVEQPLCDAADLTPDRSWVTPELGRDCRAGQARLEQVREKPLLTAVQKPCTLPEFIGLGAAVSASQVEASRVHKAMRSNNHANIPQNYVKRNVLDTKMCFP